MIEEDCASHYLCIFVCELFRLPSLSVYSTRTNKKMVRTDDDGNS